MNRPLPPVRHEAVDHDAPQVHQRRVTQHIRLGIAWLQAQSAADYVDWHQIAELVQRGCPPHLALHIVG